MDENGLVTFVNRRVKEMTGYDPSTFLGKRLPVEFVYPPDVEQCTQVALSLQTTTNEVHGEYRIFTASGDLIWVRHTARRIQQDGAPPNFHCYFRDITKEKRIEQESAKAKDFAEHVIQTANTMVVALDANGMITIFNKAAEQITGYSKAEIEKKSWFETLVPAETYPEVQAEFRRLMTGGLPKQFENAIVTKQGTERYILWHNSEIIENDAIVGAISFGIDITEKKQYEQELRRAKEKAEESETLLRNVTDNIPAYIAAVDINTLHYTFVNKQFEMGFQKPRDEIIGMHISQLIGQPNYEFALPYISEVREGKKTSYINTFNIAEGKRFIHVSYVPGLDATGALKSILVLSFDITELKQTEFLLQAKNEELTRAKERAEESDRLKSAFLANVSHEIRTPMNGILGFADLLREPRLTGEEQQQYIDIIKTSGERMLNIINDLINISKVESGQMELSFAETNINEQLDFLFNFFRLEANDKGLDLDMRTPLPFQEAVITTDREKVYAILTNLIKNAIKFTEQGRIEFGYHVRDSLLEFYVQDTGIGIPSSNWETIFQRFVQADLSLSRGYEGAGLGLSIAKAYVDILGGNIWMDSEVGKGTRFSFTLPVNRPPSENRSHARVDSSLYPQQHSLTATILIAEDDETSLLYLISLLKNTALHIIAARTGAQAVDLCRTDQTIRLVLMDLKMPEMDGVTAAKRIKEFRPELPIIAQTALALKTDKETYATIFDAYLTKPIMGEELKAMIGELLNDEPLKDT